MALDRFSGVLNGENCTLEGDERIGQRLLKITRHFFPPLFLTAALLYHENPGTNHWIVFVFSSNRQ